MTTVPLDKAREVYALMERLQALKKRRKIESYFPASGALRRELYPKHMQFFRAGLTKRVRLVMAANRVGKTETMGGYEVACHLTGIYPDWWPGRRYNRPVKVWAAGDTAKTTRDSIQTKMLGEWDDMGTGLVLGDSLVLPVYSKAGVPNAAEIALVKHATGGNSRVYYKSFDQGRESFQATEPDIIWLDEECPRDIYEESLTRTLTNNGMVIMTFTPLQGLTELVQSFLADGSVDAPLSDDTVEVITATWDDVPHLDETAKAQLLRQFAPYQRQARSKGVPQLGAGAIYPIAEEDLIEEPFAIPDHWPRAYGMDVGWNRTACVWGAYDRDSHKWHLYNEHYMGHAEPSTHVQGIRAPGEWIPGVIDPASNGRSQADGQQLIQKYRDLGLELTPADNTVEAGIFNVYELMVSGRLKVFASLQNWRKEFRLYRRDEKGHIVKKDDHIMDATRYLIVSGPNVIRTRPVPVEDDEFGGRMMYGGAGWLS